MEIISSGVRRTRRLGAALGQRARDGDVILLVGDLGAGKTCLAQGIAEGLGVEGCVTSPSFVLLREYRGRLPLYHIDFYRLDTIEEVALLGLDDYLNGDGVCVIEWAEKGMDVLPGDHLLIEMESLSANRRRLVFHPRGSRYVEMIPQLKSSLKAAGE
ncbi:MAG: tRNA (adenosine(37)-N6)-threonylcarbamoyltransferase complex ATPase subunit type 1 TsaE [Dehalococcoidia bacterium]|nr:MAG: tRNA (adenosine(37)-N6)-threonylcarbamoyltransferase complex ATPase subunit type 1 TsaE [Dehalococcoidia bacterium]